MSSADQYAAMLSSLLPPGAAWPREPGTVMHGLLAAMAEELARVDGRALRLIDEADPRTALEMLPDWERVLGLPDDCSGIPDTTVERQAAAYQACSGFGGQSIAYYVDVAARLGYDIDIEELGPFEIGDDIGADLTSDAWRFAWTVVVIPPDESEAAGVFVNEFVAGSLIGERLRGWGALDLECAIARRAPAHTVVNFAYPDAAEFTLLYDFLDPT